MRFDSMQGLVFYMLSVTGRISRYLSNKCSLAARIDNFATTPCNVFGERMCQQVESRMAYLVDGVATRKNIDVMKDAMTEVSDLWYREPSCYWGVVIRALMLHLFSL